MKIIDLFCGAGGASAGLQRAFPDACIIGVDIVDQPRYPFWFIRADALGFDVRGADLVWASPPCQRYSLMRRGRWQDRSHPDLIAAVRAKLQLTNLPWIIENVVGARRQMIKPVMLCGSMFGLSNGCGNQLRRHRLFETSRPIEIPLRCRHNTASTIGVYGGGQHPQRRKRQRKCDRAVSEHAGFGIEARKRAMGIDWMTGRELNQAIPPVYAEFISTLLFGESQ